MRSLSAQLYYAQTAKVRKELFDKGPYISMITHDIEDAVAFDLCVEGDSELGLDSALAERIHRWALQETKDDTSST